MASIRSWNISVVRVAPITLRKAISLARKADRAVARFT